MDHYQIIASRFQQTMETVAMSVDHLADPIARGSEMITQVLLNDGKIFCCGRGVDAAMAQLVCSLLLENPERERPALPAFNLAAGAEVQDESAGDAYARQVRALARDSDLLLVIDSGSGEPACLGALHAARETGMPVIVMGNAHNEAIAAALNAGDVHIAVQARQRTRCVELHTMVALSLCQLIETNLFGNFDQE
ncbi:SIS domain-containing protein [Seongchinamella unica]|uniref:SIS domain-containing protein n=1 Tax=Seongchinamella unica TaxID=2547392 RepID=A0A4R5LUR6_9GAMM|nr:SIS domain-containing protein [Seongchinamella unica]TDG15091.1 SIS domain-containing protein [Seongchinamella unica]